MPDQPKNRSSQGRDQNLSSILDSIADDGPAQPTPAEPTPERPPPSPENPYASLIEKAYGQASDAPKKKATEPAAAPAEPPRPQRSWRRELSIAGITGGAAIIALIALYAPWGDDSSTPKSAEAEADKEGVQELVKAQGLPEPSPPPQEGPEEEAKTIAQSVDPVIVKQLEAAQKRLSSLERRLERVDAVQDQLRLQASKLEALEDQVAKVAAQSSADRPSEADAEPAGTEKIAAQPDSPAPGADEQALAGKPEPEPEPEPKSEGQKAAAAQTEPPGPADSLSAQEEEAQMSQQVPIPGPLPPRPEGLASIAQEPGEMGSADGDDVAQEATPEATPESQESAGGPEGQDTQAPGADGMEQQSGSERWAISLIALANKNRIEEVQERYAAEGVNTEVVKMGRLYGLRVPGFANRAEAVERSKALKEKLGVGDVWIYDY